MVCPSTCFHEIVFNNFESVQSVTKLDGYLLCDVMSSFKPEMRDLFIYLFFSSATHKPILRSSHNAE